MTTLPKSLPLPDCDYESLTLEHWIARVPGADEVTIIVRSGGRVTRVVQLEVGVNPVVLSQSSLSRAFSLIPPDA